MTEHIVNQIHTRLLKSKLTIAVAESCTGGLLSWLLTQTPGSSRYFLLGIVAYHNSAKVNTLKVSAKLIAKKGAVSREIALEMAKGVRKLAKSYFGVGLTGIAGPSGSTHAKPKGTVFIALDTKGRKICQKFHFSGNRSSVRRKSALKALELLRSLLED